MMYLLEPLIDYTPFIPDVLGILGVLIVLWYYFLLQIGKCSGESLQFSIGNLVGSFLLLISLWYNWNLSSVMIELAWALISLYSVIRHFLRRTNNANTTSDALE